MSPDGINMGEEQRRKMYRTIHNLKPVASLVNEIEQKKKVLIIVFAWLNAHTHGVVYIHVYTFVCTQTYMQDMLSLQELCEESRSHDDKSLFLSAHEEVLQCKKDIDNLEVCLFSQPSKKLN